jgi:hypothetical protein
MFISERSGGIVLLKNSKGHVSRKNLIKDKFMRKNIDLSRRSH